MTYYHWIIEDYDGWHFWGTLHLNHGQWYDENGKFVNNEVNESFDLLFPIAED